MDLLSCTDSNFVTVELKRLSHSDGWSMQKVSLPDVFVMLITYLNAIETAISFPLSPDVITVSGKLSYNCFIDT
jgi:hypothetical protein